MEITNSIYEKALSLGYENCGIIHVGDIKDYAERLHERVERLPDTKGANSGFYRFSNPQESYPWAKSIIVCTRVISGYHIPENLEGVIGKFHAVDTRLNNNTIDYQNSVAFEDFLYSMGLKAETERKFGITALRWAAYKAGLGVIRKNNFFYTDNGSWIFLEAWFTDREMELIQEDKTKPCPAGCGKCIKACPTKSLSAPYTMNINTCIASLTTFGGDDLINEPKSQFMGQWLYGCDVCQDVCPHNKNKWGGYEDFPELNAQADNINFERILSIDYPELEAAVLPKFWYIGQERLWKWKINALNAIKNNYNPRYRYIFKEPLTQREMDTITRDEAFPEEYYFGKNNKFLHDRFGNYLIAECNCVYINGELQSYKDGIYTPNEHDLTRMMTAKIPGLRHAQKLETLRYIKDVVPIISKKDNCRYIGLKDKVFDLEDSVVTDYSPNLFLQHKLNVTYDPKAYDPLVDKTLNKICCGNKKMRLLLEEMIGFCMYRRNEMGTAFFLTEDGSNGKSTFVRMIRSMFGDQNISKASLEDLSDRFRGAMIVGKLINIGDDIGNGFIGNTSRFKALVTGDAVVMERKGKDPFEYDNYCKFIFTLNSLPRMNDKSKGLYRRMVIIPFKAIFDKNDPDFDGEFIDKLTTQEALNYLFLLALEGLKRVRKNDFTEVQEVNEELRSFEKENNPVLYFFEETEIENQLVKEVYRKYDLWSRERGYQPLSDNIFGKEVKKHLGLVNKRKRIGGSLVNVYQKV